MRQKQTKPKNYPLITIMYVLGTFAVLVFTMFVCGMVAYGLIYTGTIDISDADTSRSGFSIAMVGFALASIVIGCLFSVFTSRLAMRPINRLVDGMDRLSKGDYKARVRLPGLKRFDSRVEDSFNKLACELDNTEMLRSDFVNNFSHEFKTPIMSILGFAQLLNNSKDLTDSERRQYLKVIEEESSRLADMATNVLNMTKVENTNILTDVTRFNLSEQVRVSLLMLENKWAQKDLELDLNFPEVDIEANYELLKQVWINLLDNAIKFSSEGGKISVTIDQQHGKTAVSITNNGVGISDEDRIRIFNKFYQADKSHSGQGTGIGLAVVKKIVDLHKGKVDVISKNGSTTFRVTI